METQNKGLVGKVLGGLIKERYTSSSLFNQVFDVSSRLIGYAILLTLEFSMLAAAYGPEKDHWDRVRSSNVKDIVTSFDNNHDGTLSEGELTGLQYRLGMAISEYNTKKGETK